MGMSPELKLARQALRTSSKLLVECEQEAMTVRLAWEAAVLDAYEAGMSREEIAVAIQRVVGDELGHSLVRISQIHARERARRGQHGRNGPLPAGVRVRHR